MSRDVDDLRYDMERGIRDLGYALDRLEQRIDNNVNELWDYFRDMQNDQADLRSDLRALEVEVQGLRDSSLTESPQNRPESLPPT